MTDAASSARDVHTWRWPQRWGSGWRLGNRRKLENGAETSLCTCSGRLPLHAPSAPHERMPRAPRVLSNVQAVLTSRALCKTKLRACPGCAASAHSRALLACAADHLCRRAQATGLAPGGSHQPSGAPQAPALRENSYYDFMNLLELTLSSSHGPEKRPLPDSKPLTSL